MDYGSVGDHRSTVGRCLDVLFNTDCAEPAPNAGCIRAHHCCGACGRPKGTEERSHILQSLGWGHGNHKISSESRSRSLLTYLAKQGENVGKASSRLEKYKNLQTALGRGTRNEDGASLRRPSSRCSQGPLNPKPHLHGMCKSSSGYVNSTTKWRSL